MSSRSLQQTSLASRSVDIQAENQRLERDIEAYSENNETLAAKNSTLAIDKMSLEGQLTDARDEADELLADNDALQQRVSQLETANYSITNNTNEEFKSMTPLVTRDDFHESFRPTLDVLKQQIGSSAVWLAKNGYPCLPTILTQHLDRTLT